MAVNSVSFMQKMAPCPRLTEPLSSNRIARMRCVPGLPVFLMSTTYTFIPNNAVTYALNHSDNSGMSGPCSMRKTMFTTSDGNSDCADFVHQCLCAGGVPMFDGWFYPLSGIPSSWPDSKWVWTYSGLQKHIGKGWVQQVAYNAIQPGDFIYNYDASASPTPYTHVTIAVSVNTTVGGNFGCRVCGYTSNQHDAFKIHTSSNCRCYRVRTTLSGNGTEKKVSLPMTGSGGYVIS